jgi:hypothetical protein
MKQHVHGYNYDFDWQTTRYLGVRGSYAWTQTDDTLRLSDSRYWNTLTEISCRIPTPSVRSRTLSLQVFLRHVFFENELTERTFGLSTNARSWSVSGGLNVGFN